MNDEIDNIKKHAEQQPKSDKKRTKAKAEKPEEITDEKVTQLVPPMAYDTEKVKEFASVVFGDDLDAEENVLVLMKAAQQDDTKARGKGFGYPVSTEKLYKKIAPETAPPAAMYFGTSTAEMGELNGKPRLRNLQSLFKKLYVLVLDDIGTKVDMATLPEALKKPTYIIESSKGNYQFGYVLEEPIDDLHVASALVQLAYDSGFSDDGGKMPNKFVRLPIGVNGKAGHGCGFEVDLVGDYGEYWTPEQLLEAMNIKIKWADVVADPSIVVKQGKGVRVNTSIWSGAPAQYAALSGAIDILLEWLVEEDMVVNEGAEWFTIQCPWSADHTTGSDIAYYSPLGYGTQPNTRAFKCFHGHCSNQRTVEFLDWCSGNGAPKVAVTDNVADLVRDYVFDKDGLVWELQQQDIPYAMSLKSFRDDKAGMRVSISLGDGNTKSHPSVGEWLTSPARVTVKGSMFDPRTEDRIITSERGRLMINRYLPPQHEIKPANKAHVERFLDFLEYLAPVKEERDYLLEWLAAKTQDLSFRGCAIVMFTAGIFGTGRGTLSNIITKILEQRHVQTVTFKEIVSGGEFNEWQATPLVLVDEVKSLGESDEYNSYERLKEVIDPTSKMITINPKKEKKFEALSCSSFLFMSNHVDPIKLPVSDRRFYPVSGALVPRSPDYFAELYDWLENTDAATHLYNWLLSVEVDVPKLNARPKMTEAKLLMVKQSMTVADKIVSILEQELHYFRKKDVDNILAELMKFGDMPENLPTQVWKHKLCKTSTISKNSVRVNKTNAKVRVFNNTMPSLMPDFATVDITKARAFLECLEIDKIVTKINKLIAEE